MNSTKPQKLTNGAGQWFENGCKAMERRDWVYGVECLGTAVRLQPDELEYRKQKHRCCRRKFKATGNVSRIDSVKLAALKSRLLTAQVRDDWVTVDHLAEESLSIDPWDAQMYAHIGQSAIKAGRHDLAKYAYTSAVKIDRNNPAYLRALGGVLQAIGEFDAAKSCFSQMRATDTTGRIADELIRAVDVASLLHGQGYALAENSRDVEAGRPTSASGDIKADCTPEEIPEVDKPQTSESKLVAFVTLAEQHVQRGELATAMEGYKHALEISPRNQSIRTRMEDVELAHLRGSALDAQSKAKQNPGCERSRAAATQLLTELTSRELQILSERVARDPKDMMQAFRLADLYRRASQLKEAVPLFQKVCAIPELQVEAMIGLGECLVRGTQAEAGRQQLEAALLQIDRDVKPNAFKLAHYWLGRVYEHRADITEAVNHYAEIIAIDFNFRDAAARLAKVNAVTPAT